MKGRNKYFCEKKDDIRGRQQLIETLQSQMGKFFLRLVFHSQTPGHKCNKLANALSGDLRIENPTIRSK